MIEFSPCQGYPQYAVLNDPNDIGSRIDISKNYENGRFVSVLRNLSKPHYIIVEPFNYFAEKIQSEYLIKISYTNAEKPSANTLMPMNGGHIEVDHVKYRKG